jgi:hypothetical protein
MSDAEKSSSMKFMNSEVIMRWFGTLYLHIVGIYLSNDRAFYSEVKCGVRGYTLLGNKVVNTSKNTIKAIVTAVEKQVRTKKPLIVLTWYTEQMISTLLPVSTGNKVKRRGHNSIEEYLSELNIDPEDCHNHAWRFRYRSEEWLSIQIFKRKEIQNITDEIKHLHDGICIAHGLRYFNQNRDRPFRGADRLIIKSNSVWEILLLKNDEVIFHQVMNPAWYALTEETSSEWQFMEKVSLGGVWPDQYLINDAKPCIIDLTDPAKKEYCTAAAAANAIGIGNPFNTYGRMPFYPLEFIYRRAIRVLLTVVFIISGGMLLFYAALTQLFFPSNSEYEDGYAQIKALQNQCQQQIQIHSDLQDSLLIAQTAKRSAKQTTKLLTLISQIIPANTWLNSITVKHLQQETFRVVLSGFSRDRAEVMELVSQLEEAGCKKVRLVSLKSVLYDRSIHRADPQSVDLHQYRIEFSGVDG